MTCIIHVYVCHHKHGHLVHDEVFIPIQVGAALNKQQMGIQTDSDGDSISIRNREFCELTAIYWAWKNDREAEWVGLMHYRRYLAFAPVRIPTDIHGCANFEKLDSASAFQTGLDHESVRKHIEAHPNLKAILPSRWSVKSAGYKSLEDHYVSSDYHYKKDLDTTRQVITDLYPEYISAFEETMKGSDGYFTNVFVLRRDLFDSYCEWLFNVLFEVEKRTDLTNYSTAARRVYGYLAERLFNVFLTKVNLSNDEKFELTRTFFRDTETEIAPSSPIPPLNDGATLVIASDNNFVPHLAALLESIKDTSSKARQLQICILDGGITDKNKKLLQAQFRIGLKQNDSIHFLDCSHLYRGVDVHMHFSTSTFYRIDIGKILPNHKKVIYLDCDTIVCSDIFALWDLDIGNCTIAAAPDLIMKKFVRDKTPALREASGLAAGDYLREYVGLGDRIDEYFQAGVIVFNLDRYRNLNFTSNALDELTKRKYWFLDQDVLNKFLSGDVHLFDTSWNCVNMIMDIRDSLSPEWRAKAIEDFSSPKVIHYAGFEAKPWNNPSAPWSEMYWHHLRKTFWYEHVAFRIKATASGGTVVAKGIGYKILRSVWRRTPNIFQRPFISAMHRFNRWYFNN